MNDIGFRKDVCKDIGFKNGFEQGFGQLVFFGFGYCIYVIHSTIQTYNPHPTRSSGLTLHFISSVFTCEIVSLLWPRFI